MAAEMTSPLTEALHSTTDDVEGRMRFVQTLVRSRGWVLTDKAWDGRSQPAQGIRLAFVSDGSNQQQPMLAIFTDRAHAHGYLDSIPSVQNPFTHPVEVQVGWALLGVPALAGVMINPNTPRCFRISPEAAAELVLGVKRSLAANSPQQAKAQTPEAAPLQDAQPYQAQLLKIQNAVEIHEMETAEIGLRELQAAGAHESYVLASKALIEKAKHDYPAALDYIHRAIKIALHKEMEGEFWWLVAQIHQEARDMQDADKAYQKARDFTPDRYSYALDHARLLSEMRETDRALTLLDETAKRFPSEAGPLIFVGNVLVDDGRHEEALVAIDRAIALHPNAAGGHFNRGSCLQALGRVDEARAAYEKALTLDPSLDGHQQYAGLRKVTGGDATASDIYFKLLERRTQDDMPVSSRIDSEFALAKLYESVGDIDRSFEHLQKANELKRSTLMWSLDEARTQFERMIELFTPEFIERYRSSAESDLEPIFVLGMPRSGTTLTEQMLAAHSSVNAGGELTHLANGADAFLKKWMGKELQADVQDPELLADLKAIAGSFETRTARLQAPGKRFTDKMPGNFLHLGFIYLLYPKASVIHCRRNPIDICISCYERLFSRGLGFSYSITDLAGYYHLYLQVMAHWRRVLPADFILDVQYEDLVEEPEQNIRRILDFTGLEFEEACLNFHEVKRAVTTASSLQVRQPLYKSSVNRWKKYGKHLKPLIDALGPDVTGLDG